MNDNIIQNIHVNKCEDFFEKKDRFSEISGGLRNKCYKYIDDEGKPFFVKFYNPDTQFSRHLSETRCLSEYAMCEYLKKHNCSVPTPVFCDSKNQIGVYEFIYGQNLIEYNVNFSIIENVVEELAKIHSVPLKHEINGCFFFEMTPEDIFRYLVDVFEFAAKLYNKQFNKSQYEELFSNIVNFIFRQKQVYGNIHLHNGNIMINKKNKVFIVDFEKAPPHFPQMDLISFINSRSLFFENDLEIINLYLKETNVTNREEFLAIYDLLFFLINMRQIKKIDYNEKNLKYVWIEENGQKIKKLQKTDNDIGKKWLKDRNESTDKRLENIFSKQYSDNNYSVIIRKILHNFIH